MPGADNRGNQDERKSASDAAGAYGDEGGGYSNPAYKNPFNSPAWINFFGAGGHGGSGGAGTGVPLGPSTPDSMAATQAVANGSTVPPSLAAAGSGGLAGMPFLHQALIALSGIVPGLIARHASGGDGGGSGPDGLSALIQESVNRTRYQNPLFQAATQQAFQGLPTYARQGLSLGQYPPK